ncbi:hypothetical protein EYF80_055583 [Liparis tanakae]|uniref:Uncharacterized protein n=1 Tax=Liparis tanakae TaxID=230148 RepID=A0A4Z2EZE8_9TELE|nr:hypothetical protein EYF80_055583 [Liparis tanakae]
MTLWPLTLWPLALSHRPVQYSISSMKPDKLSMSCLRATCTEDDIKLLKTRVVTSSDNTYPADALHVLKTNKEVDNHNLSHIKKSQSHIHEIKAIDK